MATNLFKKAKNAAPFVATPKKGDKQEVQMTGLEMYAQVDAAIKALTAMQKAMGAELKEFAAEEFLNRTAILGHRPDNFRGVEGAASASMELRKRSSASALTDEEAALLTMKGLPIETKVTVPMLFAINPEFQSNDALLEKVSKAIEGIVPENFIVVQEEVSRPVVSDETIEAAFRVKGMDRPLFDIVTTLAIKPKLDTTDIGAIIDGVKTLLVAK